ncbi:Uncharacterised protein [Vibrio cholerae]|nr:Uncharacterised protein [Vibrio cholerae]CSD24747.1 Uncharacterised protein [Vibrio cholerae]
MNFWQLMHLYKSPLTRKEKHLRNVYEEFQDSLPMKNSYHSKLLLG